MSNLPSGYREPPSIEEYIEAGGAVRGVNQWDQGDLEPEGLQSVTDNIAGDGEDSNRWARTTGGGDWKGYKDGGKVYLSWDELTRRWGPVTEVVDNG